MPNSSNSLRFSIEDVVDAYLYGVRIGGTGENCTQLATKQDVLELKSIMATLGEQLTAINTGLEEIGTGVDEVLTVTTNVAGDVATLKDIIDKLQTNPGPITPEDQALVDKAQTVVGTAGSKLKSAIEALKALDAATEQPVPPTP